MQARRPSFRILAALACLAALAAAALASCDFGFLEGGDLNASEGALHSVTVDISGGYRVSWYDEDEVLQYYEEFYLDGGLVSESRRFDAAGTLEYGYRYTYDANDDTTLVARYGADGSLSWFQVKTYASAGLVETMAEFGPNSSVRWSRRYVYASGLVELSASYGSGGALDGAAAYTYDASDRPETMLAYGSVPCAVAMASASVSGSKAASPRSGVAFALPADPAYAVPAAPNGAALDALGLSGRTYWMYDAHGSTEIGFDEDFYPQYASRIDDRLDETVRVEASWDGGRIVGKKTWYGTTLALSLSLSYTADGLPLELSTSGASLLLPLDYTFAYEGGAPSRLTISSSGTVLQYFEYVYDGPAPTALASTLRTLDPFAILDGLDEANLSILHYDGDDALVETFDFSVNASGLRVDVLAPGGALNGYYVASYDADDLVASLSAYGSGGESLWSYSYGYEEAASDLAAAADAAGVDLGRITETLMSDEVSDFASAFVYDLLF